MKNWIIAALVAVIAVGGAVAAFAGTHTVDRVVEVRLWENVDDPSRNQLSIRARGGEWSSVGTVPIPLADGVSADGRYRYADLTVVLPVVVDAPDQHPLGTAESSGHWTVTRTYDPIFEKETISAILAGEGVLEKVWNGSLVHEPNLHLYCNGDDLFAHVFWEKPIFAPIDHHPIPTIRSVYVVWRVDSETAVEERWLPSTRGMATFAQYPAEFVSRLLGGERLIFRAIPSNGEDHTVTFDIPGLADVLGNLTCYDR